MTRHFGAMHADCGGTGTQVIVWVSHQSPGPTHLPPEQVSLMVQPFPSSHGTPSFVSQMQAPVRESQRSLFVQGLPSSGHDFKGPPRQMVERHESFTVHESASSQGAVFAL